MIAKDHTAVKRVSEASLIGALYVLLTLLSSSMGLAIGPLQFRLSELLTLLPAFTPAAIPGLFVGCLLSNLLCGAELLDIIFGSLATLLAAFLTRLLARRTLWLASVPPILLNTAVVPFLLAFVYHAEGTLPYFFLTIFLGEFAVAGVLGTPLAYLLRRTLPRFFSDDRNKNKNS